MTRRLHVLAIWLGCLVAGILVLLQTRFTTDLSAFLPSAPSAEQRVLVEQLRDGVVSRLLLAGIEGGRTGQRAELSRALAAHLRADESFTVVENGEARHRDRDQKLLFEYRYALSPATAPDRFTVAGLRAAIGESLDLLASPVGMMTKDLLPRDPTGELMQLLTRLDGGRKPAMSDGVWASRDGRRSLLLLESRAASSDLDGQQAALTRVRAAFARALEEKDLPADEFRLLLSGPAVFAVASRTTIEQEVTRLAIASTVLIAALLLFIYRSPTALLLGLLPVASGALAGIVAVSLGYGVVHGITLGFGTTLIGEAVDYAIYLFVQSGRRGDDGAEGAPVPLWPTIRLGVMTSVCGFGALLFSGFPGLAQLGLYSISGLVAAALTTRFVLPHLLPKGFAIRDVTPLGRRLQHLAERAQPLRWAPLVMAALSATLIYTHRSHLWNRELAALSPIPKAEQELDAALRADLGAPDVRYLVVVRGPDEETALRRAEQLEPQLQALVDDGSIGGFDSPARYLPSQATQAVRRAALPETDVLTERLRAATTAMPLRPERLAPFIEDVTRLRDQLPLTRESLAGTSFALAVDSLLMRQSDGWTALLPLRAPTRGGQAGAVDAQRVRDALGDTADAKALFIDLKTESDSLYAGYLREAALLSLAGLAAIVALLAASLRSPRRVAGVLAPLAASVLVVVAALVIGGTALTILHLVGLLLIVAVGSNYALFFDREAGRAPPSPRTLASMFFANLTTVVGFGVLGFSSVPVLQAIGTTVGPGAVLALVFSAMLARR